MAGIFLAAQDKVCEHGLGLLQPRLYTGPVCIDSAAEDGICVNTVLCYICEPSIFLPSMLVGFCVDCREIISTIRSVKFPC